MCVGGGVRACVRACVRVCVCVCVRERDRQAETDTEKGGGGKERWGETAASRCALYVSLFVFCNAILTFGP